MNRPNKKDYLTTNQFEYNQMLNKYYDALEAYIDILEKQLTLTDVVKSDSEQLLAFGKELLPRKQHFMLDKHIALFLKERSK